MNQCPKDYNKQKPTYAIHHGKLEIGNSQPKKTLKRKTHQIALTKNKLMLIIAQSLQHQYFSMGNAVVKILNGIIEGQSSSTNIQFVTHQIFLNQYYKKLTNEGEMQLCQQISISTAIFVDDLINLEGQLHDKPEIYKGKFKIESKVDLTAVEFMGLTTYFCENCTKLSTTMNREKNQNRFFPASLLDKYNSNSPKNGLQANAVNTIVRIYRHNGNINNMVLAISELKLKLRTQGYQLKSIQQKMITKIKQLCKNQPKTDNKEENETIQRKLIKAVLNENWRDLQESLTTNIQFKCMESSLK